MAFGLKNKFIKKIAYIASGLAICTSAFFLIPNNGSAITSKTANNQSQNSTNAKKSVSAPPDNLTTLCYARDLIARDQRIGNSVRIGKVNNPGPDASHAGVTFSGYDAINFVNSTSGHQFQIDTTTPVSDVDILDFNNDTFTPAIFDSTPTWYSGTTNTLSGIKTIKITDEGHPNTTSPLTELGFYTFSDQARGFINTGVHTTSGEMFTGLTSVNVVDTTDQSPVALKIVHNGAFYKGTTKPATLQTVDFGPSNRLTVFDEPTGPSPLQTFGYQYSTDTGDYDSKTGIFTNQSKLQTIDLHQNYFGDTTGSQPATLLNIPANMFSGCTSLTSIQGGRDSAALNNAHVLSIPNTVRSIGSNAFNGVPANVIVFPNDLTTIGDNLFGSGGSTTLTDLIFPNPTPNDPIKNYKWDSLISNGHTGTINVQVPYLDSYNGDITKSPYYNIFSNKNLYTVSFAHATSLSVKFDSTKDYDAITSGAAGQSGTIDMSAYPYVVKPFPMYSYINNTGADALNVSFSSDKATNVAFSVDSADIKHNDADGAGTLRINKVKYNVGKITPDISEVNANFSVVYTSGSAYTKTTIKAPTSNPFTVMFYSAQGKNFVFSPQAEGRTQWTKYTSDYTYNTLNTTLNFDGTGIASTTDSLAMVPLNSSDHSSAIANFSFINQSSTATPGSGSTKGKVETTSTLQYKANSKDTPASICKSYSITPKATLASDSSINAYDTNAGNYYILNVWGVQDVTSDDIDTTKNYDWDGTGNVNFSYSALNGKSVFYNNVSPQTPANMSYAIQNVKKDGSTITQPSCLGVNNSDGTVSITNANATDMGVGDWTFDVVITSGDDSTKKQTVSYEFDASIISGIKWTTQPNVKTFAYDINSTNKAQTLTWEAQTTSNSLGEGEITYNFDLSAFPSDNQFTWSPDSGTISWVNTGWASNLIGKYEIPVSASTTVGSATYTVNDEITISIFSLQSVTVDGSNVSFDGQPIEVGKGAGTATNPYTFTTVYKQGSAGQPTDDKLYSKDWSITVTGGSADWLKIDNNGLLHYDAGYTAGTFQIKASVTIRTQDTSPEVTGSASKNVEFKSWAISALKVDTNGNDPTSSIDNSTSGSLPNPFIAKFTGTNIPNENVTWTIGEDTTNSTAGVWNQANKPSIDGNGIISWGAGLLEGVYYFTVTATSVADPTYSDTYGTLGNTQTEMCFHFQNEDYAGTNVDTHTNNQTGNFYYEAKTFDTWTLKVRDSSGNFNAGDNGCYFKIEMNDGSSTPAWLTLDNNGTVNENGDVVMHLGTNDNTIQYFSGKISFKIVLYDATGTTVPRWTSFIFTLNSYEFINDKPTCDFKFSGSTNPSYKFNPKDKQGNSVVPNATFNFIKGKEPQDIGTAIYPQIEFHSTLTTTDGSSTDLSKYITFYISNDDSNFGQVNWTLDESAPSLYQFNGKYLIKINCYFNRISGSNELPIDVSDFEINFDFVAHKPVNLVPIYIAIAGAAAGIAILVAIIIVIRKKRMLRALNNEEKEDAKEKPEVSATGF